MFTSVQIEKFRGVEHGKIQLCPLTVLIGKNGSGKTTTLQALEFAIGGPNQFGVSGLAANSRELKRFFPSKTKIVAESADNFASIEISEKNPAGHEIPKQFNNGANVHRYAVVWQRRNLAVGQQTAECDVYANDKLVQGPDWSTFAVDFFTLAKIFPGTSESGLIDAVSHLATKGTVVLRRLVNLMRQIDDSIEDVRIVREDDAWIPYILYSDRAVPLISMGSGIAALAEIVCWTTITNQNIILLEEPETHLNRGLMSLLAHVLWNAVVQGTQIVLTSHSIELVRALRHEWTIARKGIFGVVQMNLSSGVLSGTMFEDGTGPFMENNLENSLR